VMMQGVDMSAARLSGAGGGCIIPRSSSLM
jgi:hypothetical protein